MRVTDGMVAAMRTLAVDRTTAEVLRAFEDAGCRSILVKGPALQRELYGDGALRAYVDTDLIVAPDALDCAGAALESLGFEVALDHRDHPGIAEPHAQEWKRADGKYVDLHWGFPGIEAPPERAWPILAEHAVPIRLAGVTGESLDRAGTALLIALHAGHHGTSSVRPLADLQRSLAHFDPDVWRGAAELAARLDATEALAGGLGLDPAGERLAAELGIDAPRSPRRRLIAAEQRPGSIGLLNLVEAPGARAKIRAARGAFFPAPAYMRATYTLARRGRRGLVLSYPHRLAARTWQLPAAIRAVRASRRPAEVVAERPRLTSAELWSPDRHREAAPFWRLVAESIRLAWRAGRRELVVMLAMQAAMTVLVAADVLVARSLLSAIASADRLGHGAASLAPQLVALAVVTAGLGVAGAVALHRQRLLAELCTRHGEDQVLAVTTAVELADFDEPSFHDAVERALVAVARIPGVITSMSGLLRSLAGALGAAIALVTIDPLLAPVVLLVLAPSAFVARLRGRAFYRFATSLTPQDRERRYLARTLADRDAAKEIRAYDLGRFLGSRRDGLWDARIRALRRVAGKQLVLNVLADAVAALVVSLTLFVLIAAALNHDIGLAGAGAAAAALVFLGQRMTLAAANAGGLSESALYIGDYLALVSTPLPGQSPAARAAVSAKPVHISARNVSFSYAGSRDPALRDVSLEVGPGEVVALVGRNGSGKTTLAKVLAGLYVPQSGTLTWNGADATGAGRAELRRDVALVFQDFLRYALPASDNIAIGRHDLLADRDRIQSAARTAGAHSDIETLPHGYDTLLAPSFDGGTDLSAGQWQRIALARAVFRDAPFVILDEPTAALDPRAEHDLFARIRELLAGRSVLLISHRLSSVRTADRIHVMSSGAIVESGTHEELMDHGGQYAELFTLQAAPYR